MDGLSNSHCFSERYVANTDVMQCYLEGSKAVPQPSYDDMKGRSQKAKNAVVSSWETPDVACSSSSSSSDKMTTAEYEQRRNAIAYLFAKFGYPPEENWGHGYGVITDIMTKLEIPSNSRTAVINILKDISSARLADEKYDPNNANKNKGRRALLEDGTVQGIMVCRTLQRGVGITQTTWLLNRLRAKHGQKPVSWSAVKGYIIRSPLIKCQKRRTKKSGSTDENSEWARCGKAQCEEILFRIQMSRWNDSQKAAYKGPLTPLDPLLIKFWDEHHRKAVLGISQKHEYLVSENLEGHLAAEEEGGEFNAPRDRTEAKYVDEARALCGVGLKKGEDGKVHGVKFKIFWYTGKTVLGLAKWEKMVVAELARVRPLKGCWGKSGEGYEKRYGGVEVGKRMAEKKVRQSHIPVTDMITHMFNEVDSVFPEKNSIIWHDALSQLSDKSTQAWLKAQDIENSTSWYDRFVRCLVANKGTRYEHSLVGNHPELMKGLDCHGFADFIQSTHHHVALTSVYKLGDPDRMFDGTPKQLEATMTKCWEMEPTSERIVEDISSLEDTLQKIIAANGCIVSDEDLRSGRRQAKLNGDGMCKGKARKSQRIATLKDRPTHPTALRALDLITAEAEEEFERLDRDRLQHELLAFAVDDDEDDGDDNGEPEDERGDDDEDDALALDPDSDEDDIQGGGDDDNDVG